MLRGTMSERRAMGHGGGGEVKATPLEFSSPFYAPNKAVLSKLMEDFRDTEGRKWYKADVYATGALRDIMNERLNAAARSATESKGMMAYWVMLPPNATNDMLPVAEQVIRSERGTERMFIHSAMFPSGCVRHNRGTGLVVCSRRMSRPKATSPSSNTRELLPGVVIPPQPVRVWHTITPPTPAAAPPPPPSPQAAIALSRPPPRPITAFALPSLSFAAALPFIQS